MMLLTNVTPINLMNFKNTCYSVLMGIESLVA